MNTQDYRTLAIHEISIYTIAGFILSRSVKWIWYFLMMSYIYDNLGETEYLNDETIEAIINSSPTMVYILWAMAPALTVVISVLIAVKIHKKMEIEPTTAIEYLAIYILPLVIAIAGLIICSRSALAEETINIVSLFLDHYYFTMFLFECIMAGSNFLLLLVDKCYED
jgi:hypothetical protein